MTITLYHCGSARSFRPLWALEEMQLPYELKLLPFPPRVHAKEYFEINPLGTIPTLLDNGIRMTESSAICQYVVTKYGPTPLAVSVDEKDYGPFLNWLHHGEATLTFPQTLVLRYSKLEPPERRNAQVVEDYTRWFYGRLKLLNEKLGSGAEFVCADRFTAADISVAYALMLAERLGISGEFPPAVADYWARMKTRDGFKRAIAAQGGERDVGAR
ncbi:glutathione S-transferase [Variibacter gotjawalensis]|uniref:Glutathione S-transferase n=1 Tax=Variibacter gotjawalensis TaxID=1333996 RepID=A0A0S3PZN9_9BRAD|nr:glutathione S-transferase family protein [Variibacter gotjawalensis]NIK47211.1 glutathione S-transferase [Variibacter gotjawalensis]RZS49111.1 glutathione S-transferase [Variibacter gotjawalensis]BAT61373.1 glutathione S-transferase [Variibacter gotjawalensis]